MRSTSWGTKFPKSKEHHQRRLQWRRRLPLETCVEANSARDPFCQPGHTETFEIQQAPISFSREDQWTSFSKLGKFPLILDPIVAGSQLTRVLIDGKSGLNLLFASTLKKMGLDITSMPTPS
jgi:hypothetical protein